MVVVADPRLKPHRTAGRLDAPDQASVGQRVQNVIDGLGRHRPDPPAAQPRDLLNREMPALTNSGEHRQSRRGNPQACGSQVPHINTLVLFRSYHSASLALYW
jgi:hypothetical protein